MILNAYLCWIGLGIAGTLFWPMVYFRAMEYEDWWHIIRNFLTGTILGPFSFLFFYPR